MSVDPDSAEFDDDSDVAPAPPDRQHAIYEVFNPDSTAGVAVNGDGEIVGLHITDEARENGDAWLSREIVRLARLAHAKSRVGLREEMIRNGVRPYTIDAFDLPTEASYRAMENAEFGHSS
ncbi:hypothetical protein BJY24_007679 [Nocardia transvalensis]|uniref:Uncharacterized protein n=1 Tax=Nocardia transvalensis TaxID=37333 RepID=A0A7W9UMV4_9NOCA|nr:YbaB/EbfC family nucleoid-associated protein [Nocardia transvalensis]MBB5918767.1 hypothetical protein [Nocardia transvalensis]